MEEIIRSAVPSAAHDWTCAGHPESDLEGRTVTLKDPQQPAGVHIAYVVVGEDGQVSEPAYVFVHAMKRCGTDWFASLLPARKRAGKQGEEEGEPETESEPVAPTPLRGHRAEPAENKEAAGG